MKQDELTILDVEDGREIDRMDPNVFRVVFEVPGEPYGQKYPKRLSHTFQRKQSFLKEVDLDGETVPRFEKILHDVYLHEDDDDKVGDELKNRREKVKGKKLRKRKK